MKIAALHLILFVSGINLPSLLAGDGLVDVHPLTALLEDTVLPDSQPPRSTPYSCAIELNEVERLHVSLRPGPASAAAPAAGL